MITPVSAPNHELGTHNCRNEAKGPGMFTFKRHGLRLQAMKDGRLENVWVTSAKRHHFLSCMSRLRKR